MYRKQSAASRWLNRNVFAFGLTSLLSDFCHEMATAVLPLSCTSFEISLMPWHPFPLARIATNSQGIDISPLDMASSLFQRVCRK
jgi:hypothetical protein